MMDVRNAVEKEMQQPQPLELFLFLDPGFLDVELGLRFIEKLTYTILFTRICMNLAIQPFKRLNVWGMFDL